MFFPGSTLLHLGKKTLFEDDFAIFANGTKPIKLLWNTYPIEDHKRSENVLTVGFKKRL